MEDFTKIYNNLNNLRIQKDDFVYNGDNISVIKKNNVHMITGKDILCILPYLIDENMIVLKLEDISTYKTHNANIDLFPVIISDEINDDENINDSLNRILVKETSLKLKHFYKPIFIKNKHISKNNTNRYNICILPISNTDFDINFSEESERKSTSKVVKIKKELFNEVQFFDIVSEYVRLLFNVEQVLPAYELKINL